MKDKIEPEKQNGGKPTNNFTDDLDYLKHYYTPEQIKELFESAKPVIPDSSKDGTKMWIESNRGIIIKNPIGFMDFMELPDLNAQGSSYTEYDRLVWKMKKRKALINKVVKWILTIILSLTVAYLGIKFISPFAHSVLSKSLLGWCLGMIISMIYFVLSDKIETDPNLISIKKSKLPLKEK